MPFPRRLLLEGETVALELHPHWWFFVGPAAAGVLVLGLLVGVTRLHGDVHDAGLIAFAVAAVAWAAWLGIRFLRWQATHFVVTSDRLIFRAGVLGKRGRDIPLERVNDISSAQTFFERLIGAGDLLIESAGERGQEIFSDIPHPDAVQQEIYRQIEANAARVREGRRRDLSVPDQIAALAALLDQGIISPQEFEAKKAELLARM